MKHILISLFLIFFVLTGCDNEEDSFNLDANYDFYLVDKKGNDLLDPKNEDAINTNNIRIYYLIDGKKIEHSKYTSQPGVILADPLGFYIIKPESSTRLKYSMRIFLNTEPSNGDIAYTYIEWNKNDMDTIKSKVIRKGNSLRSIMTAFNDSIYDYWRDSEKDKYVYTIVK